ncbi:MAG: ABC-F family ATP-binding cassette domain-containing protein [Bacteroidales bacterium]|nr:ABC-F family ATP-binding cassette domain-containing protein [Bacteroidales bacterium]MDD3010822.1 ABC-F family ATP-binding cassette domain-containing protein [Bacteroidales bacterium]MDD3961649.1 ABC-F family ATP-binding cassette domain-containing protein [Bacteroidales bacterium]
MNYLTVEHLTKSYGEKLLFEDISFSIEQGSKVALIANNGAGKTTLLNIITGKDIADDGTVDLRKDIRVTYLEQNPFLPDDKTVLEALFDSDNELITCIREYNEIVQKTNESNTPGNQEKMQTAMATMDRMEAWDYDFKIKEILTKFKVPRFDQRCGTLSGGQRKRVAMAKALTEEVDFLIMDEPTNHLDIEMIEWMEEFLNKQKLSLFLITHDRYFLDNVCDEIIEMEGQTLFKHKGNYSNFLRRKAEREDQLLRETERAKSVYRTELDWMRRQPQARQHKSKARIDAFYHLEQIAKRKNHEESFSFKMQMTRLGKKIIEMHNVNKHYDDQLILKNFSYTFKKEDRIGIVGPNGIGKSTFLNLITKLEKQDTGEIIHGETLKIGYYSQEGLNVPRDKRIINIVKDVAESVCIGDTWVSASVFLTFFNFGPELQYNYFDHLSGGEKRRLFLIMVLMKSPNFLILDEPTNDLDIQTLTTLENFLEGFKGVLMIVSHDRLFLDKLVDHVFAFEGEGIIKDYPGNYTDYYRKKTAIERDKKKEEKAQKPVEQPKTKQKTNKPSWKEQQEYKKLAEEINALEAEKAVLTETMNTCPPEEHEKIRIAGERFQTITDLLDEKELRWLELDELMH